ncbi:hypothetical protein [Paraburkholderia tropica]|uniref:hypothetical protein n=1 Tax=Paraburkholderia tropica TaxID=92647 RepID=UPI003D27CBE7
MNQQTQSDVERDLRIYKRQIQALLSSLKKSNMNYAPYKSDLEKEIKELEFKAYTDSEFKELSCLREIFSLL